MFAGGDKYSKIRMTVEVYIGYSDGGFVIAYAAVHAPGVNALAVFIGFYGFGPAF
jgi:hypothetical protein